MRKFQHEPAQMSNLRAGLADATAGGEGKIAFPSPGRRLVLVPHQPTLTG